jgi:TDG/mug DNA glycosylase family protein
MTGGAGQGHRVRIVWRGKEIDTLDDISPKEGGVLLVGVNPAPLSVAAGHYYQGSFGQRVWGRLRKVGLLDDSAGGWEDDAFAQAGNGLTDIVKRPTSSAADVSKEERRDGAALLGAKLDRWKPGLLLFAFKDAAVSLLGRGASAGSCGEFAGVPCFLFAGPYATASNVEANLDELHQILGELGKPDRESATRGSVPSPANQSEMLTQRITENDKEVGQIRLPRATKVLFPNRKSQLDVVLLGQRATAAYDPRTGPDRERSAVLRPGRAAMVAVPIGDRLVVSLGMDGLIRLDVSNR